MMSIDLVEGKLHVKKWKINSVEKIWFIFIDE